MISWNGLGVVESTPIELIKPNPKNPNKHPPEQIEALCKQIEYQGWRHPLIVSDRTGLLIVGHGRLAAAKKLGLSQVPVAKQPFESEEQEYAFMVADNGIALWADLDLKAIGEDILPFGPEFDLDLLGLKDFVLDPSEKYDGDADDVPDTPKEAKTKRGELWTLGKHRLLCGDATDKADVERLMAGEKADMVFTDPPYGISFNDRLNSKKQLAHTGKVSKKFGVIDGDDKIFNPEPLLDFFSYCEKVFLWGANEYSVPRGAWVVWDKKLEQQADVPYGDFELCWSKSVGWKMVRIPWGGFKNKETNEGVRFHPTQKPVALAEWFFERWGKDAKVIWDGYLGSGSTLIACEKTGRKCYGMEIEPLYIDVILSRWATYTGKDPVREDGTPWSKLKEETL